MAKVFVVYSDYSIRNIFSTEQQAEDFMDMFSGPYTNWNDIEEWTIDPLGQGMRGKKAYRVRMTRTGDVVAVEIQDSAYGFEGRDDVDGGPTGMDIRGNMYTHVMAADEKHAIKIANERRVRRIEAGHWPTKETPCASTESD